MNTRIKDWHTKETNTISIALFKKIDLNQSLFSINYITKFDKLTT